MTSGPTKLQLHRQVCRLILAGRDFAHARDAARRVIEERVRLDSPARFEALQAVAISYGRPFTHNDPIVPTDNCRGASTTTTPVQDVGRGAWRGGARSPATTTPVHLRRRPDFRALRATTTTPVHGLAGVAACSKPPRGHPRGGLVCDPRTSRCVDFGGCVLRASRSGKPR